MCLSVFFCSIFRISETPATISAGMSKCQLGSLHASLNSSVSPNFTRVSDESPPGIRALKGIPLAFIIVASLAGNGPLIRAIYADVRMRTATNIFVFNQSIADVATTLLIALLALVSIVCDGCLLSDEMCVANTFFNMYFTIITLLNLAVISLDRYFAISRTSHLPIESAKRTALYIASSVWIVAFLGAFPWAAYLSNGTRVEYLPGFYVCGSKYLQPMKNLPLTIFLFSVMIFAVVPLAVVCFSLFYIIKKIRGRRRRVCLATMSNQMRIAIEVYSKSAYTSLYVILVGLVFVFPACVTMTIDGLQVVCINPNFAIALKWLMLCHCVVKPAIYATRNRRWSFVYKRYCNLYAILSKRISTIVSSLCNISKSRSQREDSTIQYKAKTAVLVDGNTVEEVFGNRKTCNLSVSLNEAAKFKRPGKLNDKPIKLDTISKHLQEAPELWKSKCQANRQVSLEADVDFSDIILNLSDSSNGVERKDKRKGLFTLETQA